LRKVALSLLAHPDDAEILCAGTLVRLADAGWEVHIATATPGDCGTVSQTRWDISSIRANEAKKAAAVIGATYHCLDERDLMVVYDRPTILKAIELFRRIGPSVVFAHAPKDYMIDHEQTSLLARAATFGFGVPNISQLPIPEGAHVPHLYYCDPIEGIDPYGNPVKPTTLIDITAQMDRKAQMLASHASQREWLRAHHGMDEYIEAMKRAAADRGKQASCQYAEAFVQHRGHAYPREDLLAELFNKK
jgi:LmbE family N-acetylglucosaminyl deacetylase